MAFGLPFSEADCESYRELVKAGNPGKVLGMEAGMLADVEALVNRNVAREFGETFGTDWEALIRRPQDGRVRVPKNAP